MAPQTIKVTSTVCDKELVKMEKALNFFGLDRNKKHLAVDSNVLLQNA